MISLSLVLSAVPQENFSSAIRILMFGDRRHQTEGEQEYQAHHDDFSREEKTEQVVKRSGSRDANKPSVLTSADVVTTSRHHLFAGLPRQLRQANATSILSSRTSPWLAYVSFWNFGPTR